MIRRLPILASLTLLTACTSIAPASSGGVAAFRLAPTGIAAATPISAAAAAQAPGSLTVRVDSVLAKQRRLLAEAPLDRVEVTLESPHLQAARTLTLTRAQLLAGLTSLTFTGLPTGTLTVTIRALDAEGRSLQQETQHATITPDAPATVTSTFQPMLSGSALAPAVTTTVTTTSSRGGGGSAHATPAADDDEVAEDDLGTGPASLTAAVRIDPDIPVFVPAVLATHFLGVAGDDAGQVDLGADGTVWATTGYRYVRQDATGNAYQWKGEVYRFPPGGTPVATRASRLLRILPGSSDAFIRTDAFGFDLLTSSGASLLANPLVQPLVDLDQGPDGAIWGVSGTPSELGYPQIVSLNPTTRAIQQPAWHTPPYLVPYKVRVDADGKLWTLTANLAHLDYGSPEFSLSRFDPATQAPMESNLESVSMGTPSDIASDSQRHMWYFAQNGPLRKIAADGTVLASVVLPFHVDRLFVDSHDRIWAYDGSHDEFHSEDFARGTYEPETSSPLLMRLSSDGSIEAYYHIGDGIALTDLVVTPDDVMWVGTRDHGLLTLAL